MVRMIGCALVLLLLTPNAFAQCSRDANGRVVCSGEQGGAGYNPKTGNAYKSQTNSNGVTTSQTSRGGEAKTKDGKGVATTPGGKTCYKTANNEGCR